MTTRSTTIYVGTIAPLNTIVSLATVPAGFCWIVKTITIYNTAAGNANTWIGINRPGTAYVISSKQTLASATPATVQTWHVAQPGDTLIGQSDTANVYIWVSGTLLPLP